MNKYNLNYKFDEKLRDIPESPSDVLNYILDEKQKLHNISDPRERVMILGKIGSFARMLENLDDAEELLGEAVKLIDEHNLGIELWAANGIRLAHVYQWMEFYEVADEMFFNIIEMCRERKEIENYLNFALQHYGKFHFDLEEYKEALKYFEEAMTLRQEIGDNALIESTQFAIDVTKRKIKEDNVIDFPNNGFQGTDLRGPNDLLEMVKQQITMKGSKSLTIDDLNEELRNITANQNSTPKAPFLGLSPNQMNDVLYKPFDFDNNFFTIDLDTELLPNLPLIKQSFSFLEKLKEANELKCTQKGNLPRAFVIEMYNEFYSKERYARKPNKEDDLPQLTRIKHLLDMSGFIKKHKNKFSLTKNGENICDKKDFKQLFNKIVPTFFNKWNWAYSDGYSDLYLIQSSVIFNLLLLHKKAQDWTLDEDLGKVYLNAFPALVREAGNSYLDPEQEIIKCFSLRFLNRICLPLGIVEIKEEGEFFERKTFYKVSDFFKENFKFYEKV